MNPLEAPRQVTGEWHIVQTKRLLAFDAGRHLDTVLVYAAVELRAAIERTLFELLYLLKEGQISEKEVKRCRSINGITSLMREADPAYRKTLQFTRLVASVTPGVPEIAVIDSAYLNRWWNELSEYCHLQFRPAETFESPGREFQHKGFALVNEVLSKLLEWYVGNAFGFLAPSSLPEETRGIYDKFLAGEIDEGQARTMLVLTEPALRRRLDLSR
jgi:hypothetical protein